MFGNYLPNVRFFLCVGKGSQIQNGNTYVHSSLGSRHPQDEFRQAHVVQSHPTDAEADGTFNQGLPNRQYPHTASGFSHSSYPPFQYFKSSLANPKRRIVDSSKGNAPQKQAFSLSSSIAGGTSVSKHDSSDKHTGIGRTWPYQQGTRRTSQYASGKSDFQSPSRSSYLFPSGSNQPLAWKPHSAAKPQQEPSSDMGVQFTGPSGGVLNPLEKFVQKPTSAFARGRRVNQKVGSRKPWSLPFSQISKTPYNPVAGTLHEHYEQPFPPQFALHQPHQVSAYNQNPPLGLPHTGTASVPVLVKNYDSTSGRLGPGQRLAPTKTHNIPSQFGGYAIKRLTDEESDEPVTTPRPVQSYTFPPRQTESFTPRQPRVHHKSKWLRIKSSQLIGEEFFF